MTYPEPKIWIAEVEDFDYFCMSRADAQQRVTDAQLMGFMASCYEAPASEFAGLTSEHRSLYAHLMKKVRK